MGDRTSSGVAAGLLRAAGLRVTAPRCAAVVWLDKHPHATAHGTSIGTGARHRAHGRWLILATQ